jgi:hypothetical protein
MILQWILLHLLLINLNWTTVITSCHLLLLENGNNTDKGKDNYEHQTGETRQDIGSKEGDGLSDSLTTRSRERLSWAHGESMTAEEENSVAAAHPGGNNQLRA